MGVSSSAAAGSLHGDDGDDNGSMGMDPLGIGSFGSQWSLPDMFGGGQPAPAAPTAEGDNRDDGRPPRAASRERRLSFETDDAEESTRRQDDVHAPEERPAARSWAAEHATRMKAGAASERQLQLLQELSSENKRLKALQKHYSQRLASPLASVEQFELLKQSRTRLTPTLLETHDGILCEAQINKSVAIKLEHKHGRRSKVDAEAADVLLNGHAEKITVRKCWATGETGRQTSAIRALGTCKYLAVDDCHKSTVLCDGVSHSVSLTDCTNLTLALGGDLPHLDLTRCRDINILGCVPQGPGYSKRPYSLSMSCCEGVVTWLLPDESHKLSALDVVQDRGEAIVIHLPDAIEALVDGNTVTCQLENSQSVPDQCLALTGDTTVEFTLVERDSEISNVKLHGQEQQQISKHLVIQISCPKITANSTRASPAVLRVRLLSRY